MEKSRLDDLSDNLTDDERKALLGRVSRKPAEEQAEDVVPVELPQEERARLIARDMQKADFWTRFLLWWRGLITGRGKKEVFVDLQLRKLRNRIRGRNPGLSGFETRDLTPKFARSLYDVFSRAYPLLGPYYALTSEKNVRTAAYAYYVEMRLPQPKKKLAEFLSDDEMEEIYAASGQTEDIRKKLYLRLNDYLKSLPDSLFSQLEEQVRLHLHAARLVLFPFAGLFRYFNYTPGEALDPRYPVFGHAPAMLMLDLLERFSSAVVLLRRHGPAYAYAEEPLAYQYFATTPAADGDPGKIEQEMARIRQQMQDLFHEVDGFDHGVPLFDLIRYFRKDPYYSVNITPPPLHLKAMYFSRLKGSLTKELEERIATIRQRVVRRKIQEMFRGQKTLELAHYREVPAFDFRKMGLPYFVHPSSLAFVCNFMVLHYKQGIQEAVQLMTNYVLGNNRITQNRLLQSTAGLEDLDQRILLFDRSLSPEEEDGKLMIRFRYNVASDLVLQKSYRSFVQQKDKDARDMVDRAKESLTGVKRILDEVRTSTMESIRSALKTLHMHKGRSQTLAQILNTRADGIGNFLLLLDQLVDLEKSG